MEPRDIIEALIAKGMTQAEIAALVGVHQPAISKVLRGATEDVKSATYRKLAALHGYVQATGRIPTSEPQA